jgi:hypothetical protein
MTKVLVSRGFGAGWSTWSTASKQVAEYAPVIDFIEKDYNDPADLTEDHPIIVQMIEDLDIDGFYAGGASDLEVVEIPDGVRYLIREYDGAESIVTEDTIQWW